VTKRSEIRQFSAVPKIPRTRACLASHSTGLSTLNRPGRCVMMWNHQAAPHHHHPSTAAGWFPIKRGFLCAADNPERLMRPKEKRRSLP
jgi:hypothetical protein